LTQIERMFVAFKVCLVFKKMDRQISDVSQNSVIVPTLYWPLSIVCVIFYAHDISGLKCRCAPVSTDSVSAVHRGPKKI
jgi:hypothetical protein